MGIRQTMPGVKRLAYKLLYPVFRLYWRVVRPQTHGVRVLIADNGDVLLVRHSYGNTRIWGIPGGGFNPQRESAESAGIREVREELGMEIRDVALLGTYTSTAEYKRDTVHCVVGYASARSFTLSPELSEAAWFSLNTLPETLTTATKKSLTFFLNGFGVSDSARLHQ